MQPSFDSAFYERTHIDLEDELLKLALSVQYFNEQTQEISAIWPDDAGRRIRQINMLPMLEQAKLFDATSTQFFTVSEEKLRIFYEMKRLISEYAGFYSSLEERGEQYSKEKEEYHRATSLSERLRDKSIEFASHSANSRLHADSHVSPL